MKLILDFSKAGFWTGVKHLIKGALLYAAIGAVGYLTTKVSGWHGTTPIDFAIAIGVGETLQGISKWLTTQKNLQETEEIVVPATTEVTEPTIA